MNRVIISSQINDESLWLFKSWKIVAFIIFFSFFLVLTFVLGTSFESFAYCWLKLFWFAVNFWTLRLFWRKIIIITCLHHGRCTSKLDYCWLPDVYWCFCGWPSFKICLIDRWCSKLSMSNSRFRLWFHGRNIIFASPVEKIKFVLSLKESWSFWGLIFNSLASSFWSFEWFVSMKFEVWLIHGAFSNFQVDGFIFEKIVGFDAVNTHTMLYSFITLIFFFLLVIIFLIDGHACSWW